MKKKIGEKNTTFFSFWNITLDLKPKWVQPTWTLVSVAIAWTRRCTGTCFATICRFGIIAFSFPSLPTATTTLRTFTPRAPIAPVSINYKKKWMVETSSRPVSSSNNSYWTSTEYLTLHCTSFNSALTHQPKFLTFTNTTSSLALEILERWIIAVTLFLVVFAFLCAESIAV